MARIRPLARHGEGQAMTSADVVRGIVWLQTAAEALTAAAEALRHADLRPQAWEAIVLADQAQRLVDLLVDLVPEE